MALLTHEVWILAGYGYDENGNGSVDVPEQSIRDCEKDNRYNFFAGGKGLFEENNISCGNGISEMPFSWKFREGEQAIDFITGIAKILRLTESELVLSRETVNASGQPVKLLIVFRH